MKLCTFSNAGAARLGAIVGDTAVDLAAAAAALGTAPPAAGDLRSLLEAGPSATNGIRELVGSIGDQRDAAWAWPLAEVALHHPYRPRKNIVRAGANVRRPDLGENGPAAVTLPPGRWLRGYPIAYYTKSPTAVLDPGAPISWPVRVAQQVYADPQLAIVVGDVIRYASPEEALEKVFGYAVATDVSALDLRIRHGQWPKAGSLDSFFPWGPAIVTRDEVGDPGTLDVRLDLNGSTVARASTADALLSVGEMLAEISTGIRLDPGDVLMLGVPEAAGGGQTPPRWLGEGDTVTSTVERVGSITNPVQPTA